MPKLDEKEKDPPNDPGTPDDDDKKIMADMKKEGIKDDLIDDYDKKEGEEEPASKKTPPKDKDGGDAVGEEEEEEEEDEEDSEDAEGEEVDEDESEGESAEEGAEGDERRERPIPTWAMVKKLNEEVASLKGIIEKRGETIDPATQKEIDEFAKKHGTDPQALAELASIFAKRAGLSPDDRKLLDESRKRYLDSVETEMHQRELSKVFKHFPELKGDKQAVRRLESLAYTPRYKKTSLIEIYLDNKERILQSKGDRGTRSGEPSRGGSQKGQVKDLKQLAKDEKWGEMTDKEFEEVSHQLVSEGRNRTFVSSSQ